MTRARVSCQQHSVYKDQKFFFAYNAVVVPVDQFNGVLHFFLSGHVPVKRTGKDAAHVRFEI